MKAELDTTMKPIGELDMQVEQLEAKRETSGPLGRRMMSQGRTQVCRTTVSPVRAPGCLGPAARRKSVWAAALNKIP